MRRRGSTRARPNPPTSCGSRIDTACSSAASSSSPRAAAGPDDQPVDRGDARRWSPRPTPTTWLARSTRPATPCLRGRPRAGAERAKYVLPHRASAAGARARVRGARDDERRQADQGDHATSTCRSRPRTSSTTRAGPTSSSTRSPGAARLARVGVAGQIIPWNFPLLMAAWKLAPALAAGNTRRAEARRDDAAHRAAARRGDPGGRAAAGRREHHHRGRGDRRRARRGAGVDKIAFTGSTEVGKAIQRSTAGTGTRLTLELGGKAANIVFEDAPLDQAVEGVINGIFFNQGHVCCAGSRLLVQEPVFDVLLDKLKDAPAGRSASAIRSTRTPTSARSTRKPSSRRSSELVRVGRRGGRRDLPAAVRPARPWILVRADAVHRRLAVAPHRARGDLRPRALDPHVPHGRRGRREGEQHSVRPVGRRLDREGVAHPADGRTPARRRRVGEHVQPVRPDVAVRRLQGERLRPRRRPARPRALPEFEEARRDRPGRGPPHGQAVHRRGVPAQRDRTLLRGHHGTTAS